MNGYKTTALLLGTLVLLAACALSVRNDVQHAQDRFAEHGAEIENTLIRRLDSLNAALLSLGNMHHAMTRLSAQELSAFAQGIGRSHPYVRAILQFRQVDDADRQRYEASRRDSGFPSFAIHPAGDGQSQHPLLMPLHAIEPLDPALVRHLGVDALSSPTLRGPLLEAIESGDASVAPGDTLGDGNFLLLRSVYRGFFIPHAAHERRAQAHGAYALMVDTQAFAAEVLADRRDLSLVISIRDTERETYREIFTRHATTGDDFVASLLPVSRRSTEVEIGKQRLRIDLQWAPGAGIFDPAGWLQLIVPLLGLYIAALLVATTRLRASEQARQVQEQLFEQQERAHVTLQSIGEAVITTDPTAVVDFMNPAAERLTGWRLDDACGRHLNEIFSLVSEADGTALPDPIARALRDNDESEAAAIMVRSDGVTVAVIENAAAIRDREGNFTGAALIVRDVSRERNLLREMAFQATHDPLTRLINRRQFERELAAVVEDAANSSNQHALMYIDVDQFKAINDSCGHIAGDQMLKQIAHHLGDNVRRLDRLARLGGDEFGVLLRDCTIEKALEVAEALRHEIKDLRLHWEDRTFTVSLSIGVVAINDSSGNLDKVLRAADAACYVAKDQGRNRVHFYEPDDQMLARRSTDMQWLHKLREAIENDRLTLHGQTIFPLADGSTRPPMCELLVRMIGDDGRMVPPMTFIPAAERFNLMFDLDIWVITEAFRQLAKLWKKQPDDPRVFTINLSGQSLDHPDLEIAIQGLQRKYAVNAHRICFEITETSVIANMERALELMDKLRRSGFLFALDDFGTGLSSFAYLKKLPVDYLKIDGEFVRDILSDPVDKAMVDTIQRIGGVLGMATVAEAIEDAETCQLLTAMGINYGQGYQLARPGPVDFLAAASKVAQLKPPA